MNHRALAIGLGICVVTVLAAPTPANAQPKFAIEVEGGRNVGLTPYLQNVVYTGPEIRGAGVPESEAFEPYLADERSGWGSNLGVRLISKGFQAGLTMRWFDVSEARVHHRGRVEGHPDGELRATRIRPDGTVDDSGTNYRELDEPVEIGISPSKRANLFVFGAEAGYRFYVYRGDFDIFTPVAGSLILTHLGRRFAPFRPGLDVKSGVSASFDFVSVMSINVGGRLHALATPTYWNRSDAARRAAELDQTTESALFSTQLYVSLNVALEFAIR